MKKHLIALLILFPFVGFTQTVCTSNMAGIYPCNDYDLMSNFNKNTLSSRDGSDIWGWTDSTTNKEYALMTFEDKICFLDVTNPISPIYLGFVNTNASSVRFWRDVKVYNNTAYIVADQVGAHGVQVFDLERLRNVANPPENFTPDSVLTAGFGGSTIGSCHNIIINETVAKAYIVGCNSANGGGPMVLDLTNRLNPVAVGQYTGDGYTHDAQVVTYSGPDTDYTGKQIMVASNEDEVTFLDVTDHTNITEISSISYTNYAYVHQGWFTEDFNYVLIGDEFDEQNFGNNTKTIILKVTDLDNPTVHGTYEHPTNAAIDHNIYIKGNLAYEANYRAGFRVLDISDIANGNLTEVGYFDTYPTSNSAQFSGAWSVYPYFSSGNIIVSDINRGLFVLRKTGSPLAIGEEVFKSSDVSIYPNPANNSIHISSQNLKLKKVMLFNVLGQVVFEQNNENQWQEMTLDISSLNEGIYRLRINDNVSKKMIINR